MSETSVRLSVGLFVTMSTDCTYGYVSTKFSKQAMTKGGTSSSNKTSCDVWFKLKFKKKGPQAHGSPLQATSSRISCCPKDFFPAWLFHEIGYHYQRVFHPFSIILMGYQNSSGSEAWMTIAKSFFRFYNTCHKFLKAISQFFRQVFIPLKL